MVLLGLKRELLELLFDLILIFFIMVGIVFYTTFSYAIVAGTIFLLSTIFRSVFDYSKLDQLLVTPLTYRQALWFSNRKNLKRIHLAACIAMWVFCIGSAFITFPLTPFFFSSVMFGLFLFYRFLFVHHNSEKIPQFIMPFGKEFLPFFFGTVLLQMFGLFCFGGLNDQGNFRTSFLLIIILQTIFFFFWHLMNYLEMVRKIEGHMRD